MYEPDSISVEEVQEINLPLYYRENFFSNDTIFYTERTNSIFGVAGDPVPYTVRGDDLLTSLLLVCIIFMVVFISRSKHFISQQVKDILFASQNGNTIHETSAEIRSQIILAVMTCLVLAICTYQYVIHYVTGTFIVNNDFILITLFFAGYLLYFPLKVLFYSFVNSIFFEKQQNRRWKKNLLFIFATEGFFIFPAALLLVYFDLSPQKAIYYIISVLLLSKIVTIYKCWHIFFSQKGGFLQTFLYFCTLEIVPLLNLISGMLILIDHLKFNF